MFTPTWKGPRISGDQHKNIMVSFKDKPLISTPINKFPHV